jgi:hypothetical protein
MNSRAQGRISFRDRSGSAAAEICRSALDLTPGAGMRSCLDEDVGAGTCPQGLSRSVGNCGEYRGRSGGASVPALKFTSGWCSEDGRHPPQSSPGTRIAVAETLAPAPSPALFPSRQRGGNRSSKTKTAVVLGLRVVSIAPLSVSERLPSCQPWVSTRGDRVARGVRERVFIRFPGGQRGRLRQPDSGCLRLPMRQAVNREDSANAKRESDCGRLPGRRAAASEGVVALGLGQRLADPEIVHLAGGWCQVEHRSILPDRFYPVERLSVRPQPHHGSRALWAHRGISGTAVRNCAAPSCTPVSVLSRIWLMYPRGGFGGWRSPRLRPGYGRRAWPAGWRRASQRCEDR